MRLANIQLYERSGEGAGEGDGEVGIQVIISTFALLHYCQKPYEVQMIDKKKEEFKKKQDQIEVDAEEVDFK